MPGAIASFFPAGFVFPSFSHILVGAAPLLAVAAVGWLINRTDRIVGHLFPDLEWEKSLGWLNTKAERRANTAMRWFGYAIHVLLFDSLCGILWAAVGFPDLANWSDPAVMGDLALRISALGLCLGIWIVYLGCGLVPKLRAQREKAALKKFRREMEETENEREMQPRSRLHAPLPKPRTNAALASFTPNRTKWPRQPGG